MADDKPTLPPLSERAKYRLRLAAAFLRARGHAFDVPREAFYDAVQASLNTLSPEERQAVKETVDWTEEFDPDDTLHRPPTRRARHGGRQPS